MEVLVIIKANDALAARVLLFKDGQPLGTVNEVDIRTMAYKQLQYEEGKTLEEMEWVEGVADFAIVAKDGAEFDKAIRRLQGD
jgi:hypothetical protein